MISRRAVIATAAGIAAGGAGAQTSDFPKPGTTIRYVVPFPPGGLTDVMARLVGEQLATRWKVSVVVENKAGASAQIGAEAVAKSPPDGSTILAITLSHAANATLFRGRAKYDFEKDLRPVALLAGSPILVVVPAASPITSLRELVVAAKARPLNAGSSGSGTPPHLTLALFNQLNGTAIQHVPYKGGAPSIADLVGGQIDVIFSNFPESIAQVKGGRLRALAIATAQRHPQLPEVPTTAEAGMPQVLAESWTAVMAPSGTPDAVVQRLGDEFVAIMALPEVADKARAQGFRIDARGPREFGTFLQGEVQRWRTVIETAGIKAD